MDRRSLHLPLLIIVAALGITWWVVTPATYADTHVVGDGTLVSCTETALAAVLAGGGTITFACGGAQTIPITRVLLVANDTTIDGGGQITLDGGGVSRIFYVNKWEQRNNTRFTLQNITLANGQSGGDLDPTFGGCIYSRKSVLQLSRVALKGCKAVSSGGGVYVYGGNATITESAFTSNQATRGGALYAMPGGATEAGSIGNTTVINSSFTENVVRGDGGAIYMGNSPLVVQQSTFTRNAATGVTGQAYAGLGGGIYTNLAGAVATINDSSFIQNMAHESGGGLFADYYTTTSVTNCAFIENTSDSYGGGLSTVRATVTIASSVFRRNHGIDGGGIYSGGNAAMTITGSTVAENTGEGGGGGIYNSAPKLTVSDTSVISNTAGTTTNTGMQGGGLVSYSGTSLMISGSTFANNQAIGTSASGGGIWFGGTVITMTNTTVSGNRSSSYGGGIQFNRGTALVASSTIAGNTAPGSGPNIGFNLQAPTLKDSLVVGSASNNNCNKPVLDGGHNLQFPNASCGTSIPVADPQLTTLQDNGGPTLTQAIAPTSPALDQGVDCPSIDQRGYLRGDQCDIGAFEIVSSGTPQAPSRQYLPIVQIPAYPYP